MRLRVFIMSLLIEAQPTASVINLLKLSKCLSSKPFSKLIREVSHYKKPCELGFNFNRHVYEMVILNSPHSNSQMLNVLRFNKCSKDKFFEFSLMDIINHFIYLMPQDHVDYKSLIDFKNMLVKYDRDSLLTKTQKGYITTGNYTEWMFAPEVGQFGGDFSNFVRIIASPALRKIIGDRLRYFKFDDPNKYRALGITPPTVADLILNHPYADVVEFTGLKSPRHKLISYLSQQDFLVYYFNEDGDDIFDDRDTLFTAFIVLVDEENLSRSYAYIQAVLLGMYFNDYTQWLDRIRVGGEVCPRFTVHHHTLIREIYSEDFRSVEKIDWSLHPKDNFDEIIEWLIDEQVDSLKVKKPMSIQKPLNIHQVKELVTGSELLTVGDQMNICIGGQHYIHYLPCEGTHYYQLGEGKPEDRVVAEIKRYGDQWRLSQVVTVGNKSVGVEHPQYENLTKLKSSFCIKDVSSSDTFANMPRNLQQSVIYNLTLLSS